MKCIEYKSTLFYYDGPQVFEARDAIGGHYLAVMTEYFEDMDSYLVVGVSPERLRDFRAGLVDLRAVLEEGAKDEWFIAGEWHGLDEPIPLIPQRDIDQLRAHLPEPGFFLHDRLAESPVLQESRKCNNLVLELILDPPEAAMEHRIRLATMVGLLNIFQITIRHALATALRNEPQSVVKRIDREQAGLLDVVAPATAGSFRIVLEAGQTPDMFGHAELSRALERFDILFEHVADPQKAVEIAKENRGRLAGAYLRLLRFLDESKMGLRYSWAQPAFTASRDHAVAQGQVRPLVDALAEVSDLGTEDVEITGVLEKADSKSGTWRVHTGDDAISGKTLEIGPSLDGLKIGSHYTFFCVEQTDLIEGTGREQRTLWLTRHKELKG